MSAIKIEKINKYYGDNHIIKDVSLEIKSESFTVLVGPSGCGKSTILRMIAGLEDINSGTIAIDDTVVNDLAPKERNIAMVFQSYALYPHMTVFNNMAFGLKLEKRSKDEINERVHEAAKILQIEDYLERKPKQLSWQRKIAESSPSIRRITDLLHSSESWSANRSKAVGLSKQKSHL